MGIARDASCLRWCTPLLCIFFFLLTLCHAASVQCAGSQTLIAPANVTDPTPSDITTQYDNTADCTWVVYGGGGVNAAPLALNFFRVDLAPAGCADSITVYDGATALAPLLTTLCGNQTGFAVASAGVATVRFQSDAAGTASGFNAMTHCSGVTYVGDGIAQQGVFSAQADYEHGYYRRGISCTFVIHVAENYVIAYQATTDVPAGDYLTVYDGDSTDFPSRRFPAQTNYNEGTSSRNVLTVVFTSAGASRANTQYRGFKLAWFMQDLNIAGFHTPVPHLHDFDAAWVQAPFAWNGLKAGGNVATWATYNTSGEKCFTFFPLKLTMGDGNLTLYNGVDNYDTACASSYACIPLMPSEPVPYFFNPEVGRAVTLVYTPGTTGNFGFLGLFKAARDGAGTCDNVDSGIAVGNQITFSIPEVNYGTMNYEPNVYCYRTLTVLTGRVGLNFTAFDIQPSAFCIADALEVYDGAYTSAPRIGSYCGSTLPAMIVASGPALTLVFRSDGFMTQYKGVKATAISTTTLPATTGGTGVTTSPTTTYPPGYTSTPVTTATGATSDDTSTTTDGAATSTTDTAALGASGGSGGSGEADGVLGMLGGNMLYVLIGAAVLIAVCVAATIIVCMRRRRRRGGNGGETTMQMDLFQPTLKASFADSGMKARVEGLLKAGSTKKIGTGGTAKVYRAEMDGKMVALKVLSEKNVKASLEFHREANILSRLTGKENQHVIQLVLFCNEPPCLVCELAEQGSLSGIRSEFKSYAADKQKDILFQVSEGMEFLHANSIVHLDLKPDNVLLGVGGVCKVSDFGSSAILGEDLDMSFDGLTAVRDFNGTPHYAAPERFRLRMKIDMKKADVFSFGVMAWSLMSGEAPYAKETGASIMGVYSSMREGDPITLMPLDMNVLNGVDTVYAGVTRECMDPAFVRRPSFVDVSGMLRTNSVDRTRIVSPSSAGSFNSGYNSQFNSENMYGSEMDSGSASMRNPTFDSYNASPATGSMRGPPTLPGSRTDTLRGPGSRSGSRADQMPPPNLIAAAGGHPRSGSNAEPPSRPSRAGSAADQRPANYPRSASATRPGPPPPPRQ